MEKARAHHAAPRSRTALGGLASLPDREIFRAKTPKREERGNHYSILETASPNIPSGRRWKKRALTMRRLEVGRHLAAWRLCTIEKYFAPRPQSAKNAATTIRSSRRPVRTYRAADDGKSARSPCGASK